jgi:hypothetical protein
LVANGHKQYEYLPSTLTQIARERTGKIEYTVEAKVDNGKEFRILSENLDSTMNCIGPSSKPMPLHERQLLRPRSDSRVLHLCALRCRSLEFPRSQNSPLFALKALQRENPHVNAHPKHALYCILRHKQNNAFIQPVEILDQLFNASYKTRPTMTRNKTVAPPGAFNFAQHLLLANQARHHVYAAASRVRHHDAHGSLGKVGALGACAQRQGSQGCALQQGAAFDLGLVFHEVSPGMGQSLCGANKGRMLVDP